jgi:hypothetical protein
LSFLQQRINSQGFCLELEDTDAEVESTQRVRQANNEMDIFTEHRDFKEIATKKNH